MSEFGIKRLDHHGIVMGVVQDLDIIQQIDSRLGQHQDEKLSVGTRVAAMIVNGLGFTDQPLSLVPEFFEELPIEHLFGKGICAADFDRFSLSRALDRVSGYGEESLFAEVASHACRSAQIDRKTVSLDTTTFSFTGEYSNAGTDEDVAVNVTHGYSKDKRSDLKQVVTELLVSHDGGVPLVLKNWDGNTSDTAIFQQRTEQLVEAFRSGYVSHVTADSKFYTKENAKNWDTVKFTTRVPETIIEVKDLIQESALEKDWSISGDGKTKYIAYDITHYEAEQRWLVCQSEASLTRAETSVHKQIDKERIKVEKELFHLQAQRFKCKADAESYASKICRRLKYHDRVYFEYRAIEKFDSPGNAKNKEPSYYLYQVMGTFDESKDKIQRQIHQKSCFVLATNVDEGTIPDNEVIQSYKDQQHVERGFRFLKDPQFFANAFFLKKESRISALIMIMTLALLVYSIAQKRLTAAIREGNVEFKNHAGVKKKGLTLRRAFQLFRGIYTLPAQCPENVTSFLIDGLNEIRVLILNLLSGRVLKYYFDGRRNDLLIENRET